MPAPGIVTGRNIFVDGAPNNEVQGRFFSSFPASTPKFALNAGPRRSEFVETMARLSIDMSNNRRQRLLRSLPADTAAAAQTLLNAGNANGAGYFDFLLTSVTQQKAEREQAVDTLTDNTVIYYSGQSAPVLSCQGVFLNTYQDDQNVWFQLLYADLLRGTQLARRGLAVRFRYDSYFMTGYLTGLSDTVQGSEKNSIQFSFMFRVKQIQIATPIIYNPTLAQSLLTSNLFVSGEAPGADDLTRHGLQSSEQPLAPLAVPAASTQAETDPREQTVTQGIPEQEQQEARDHAIYTEIGVVEPVTFGAVASAVADAAATPVLGSTGDIYAQLDETVRSAFQDFRTQTLLPSTSVDDLQRQLDEDLAQLQPSSSRGAPMVSPVDGAATTPSTYADTIARGAATPPTTPTTGPAAGEATSATEEALLDVYKPKGALLQELLRSQQATQPKGRTRQRPTP